MKPVMNVITLPRQRTRGRVLLLGIGFMLTILCHAATSPLDLKSDIFLFMDEDIIAQNSNLTLQMHSPEPKEVVFVFDAPWEGLESGYVTLLKDNHEFRMYYRGGGELTQEQTCVAISNDGIVWHRPELNLFEFNGSKTNNIVWISDRKSYGEAHNFTPFIDQNPKALPEERYKAVGLYIYPDETGNRRKMLVGFVSPDGLHWKRVSQGPIFSEGAFDSQNIVYWDTIRQSYVCYFRMPQNNKRGIGLAVSNDFLHWTSLGGLDYHQSPPEHFYTNAMTPYFRNPRLRLGFPMRFVPERKTIGNDNRLTDGLSDAVFISSWDGIHWKRSFMEAFIRPGLNPNNWGNAHGNMTPAWGILPTSSEEISIYWMDNYGTKPQLRRGTVRLDGFTSLQAPFKGGEWVSKPLKCSGNRLMINYATSAVGSLRFEILDSQSKPVPGYQLKDSVEIYGDEIHRIVSWNGKSDLYNLKGQTIQFHVVMKDADLYSFQFNNEVMDKK